MNRYNIALNLNVPSTGIHIRGINRRASIRVRIPLLFRYVSSCVNIGEGEHTGYIKKGDTPHQNRRSNTSSANSNAGFPKIKYPGSNHDNRHHQNINYNEQQNHHQRSSNRHSTTRFGTQTIIKPTSKCPYPPNHPLAQYIQNSLSHTYTSYNNHYEHTNLDNNPPTFDTSFNISFLGTGGGGRPSRYRNPSSTALRINGKTFLFDAGESTQKQIAFSQLSVMDIQKIFITHLHLDHVGGLIPLILNVKLALAGSFEKSKRTRRQWVEMKKIYENGGNANDDDENYEHNLELDNDLHNDILDTINGENDNDDDVGNDNKNDEEYHAKTNPGGDPLELEIYGPVGLFNYIAVNLALTYSSTFPVKVIVCELVDEYCNSDGDEHQSQQDDNDIHRIELEGIKNPFLERRKLYKDRETNTWSIQHHPNKQHPTHNIHKQVKVEAALVNHKRNVQTLGFVITEPTPQPTINVNKAISLGVKPSKKYRALKSGKSVISDDGTKTVYPHQVLICGDDENDINTTTRTTKGRKVVLMGDTFSPSKSMMSISQNCDVLVHEATLLKGQEKIAHKRGHSTAHMAGRIAKKLNAKALVLNHISSKNDDDPSKIRELMKAAHRSSRYTCQVASSYDFMELSIPRNGFQF